jgi:tetratricopeptide (TPR) repeat protein
MMHFVSLGASAFVLISALAAGSGAAAVEDQKHREALDHYRAGQAALYSENWPAAEREFRAAIGLDPLLVLAHYSLGQTYMSMKQYPQAVKAFMGCRQAYLDVTALQSSDKVKADQRREEEIQELRESIRMIQGGTLKISQPEMKVVAIESRIQELESLKRRDMGGTAEVPAEFSLALGSAYFRSGALTDAQREYEAALRVRPKFGEAHNNLAVVFMLQGRLEDASAHLKAAEKNGFHVNPNFKADLEKRLKGS